MPDYKILIIDYEPRGIQHLSQPLERAGYQIEVAKDGLLGIQAFARIKPDLTLIEAMLPKKHGFEVCQELKATPHGMLTPIVIVTSVYKGRKYRTQALHHYGCDEYLEKPIEEERLLETVARLVQESAARRADAAPAEAPAGDPAETPAEHRAAESQPAPSGQDSAELEIMERLDDLLGGTNSSPAPPPTKGSVTENCVEVSGRTAAGSSPVSDSRDDDKVISFDLERARKRRQDKPSGRESAPARSAPIQARGSAEPVSLESLHRHEAVHEESETIAPDALPQDTVREDALLEPHAGERKGARLGWIWFAVALTIAAGAVLVYLFGPIG